MNVKQKIVICIGVILIAATGLYPPWLQSLKSGDFELGPTAGAYHSVFDPPQLPGWVKLKDNDKAADVLRKVFISRLDVSRLLIEWATVLIVCTGLVLSFGGAPSRDS